MENISFVIMLNQLKERTVYERIELILTSLLAASFLINQKLVILIILALLLNAVYGGLKQGFRFPNRTYFPFIILFFLYVIGLLFTTNFDYGGKDIESRLVFVLFPLIYGVVKREKAIPLSWVIWFFMAGACFYMLVSWIYAQQCALIADRPRFCFESYALSDWIHPTYAALYLISGSLFILIHSFNLNKNLALKSVALLISIITLFFVYHLYSLGPWIAFITTLAILCFVYFYLKKRMLYFFVGIAVMGTVGFFAIRNLDLLRSDYDAVSNELNAYFQDREAYIEANQNNVASVKARLIIWNVSWDFVLEHPFGVGTGDRKDELLKYYRENGMDTFAEKELNPHSQYLQTAMAIGIASGLFLIFSFLYYLWVGIKTKHFYLIVLISLFATACLFESVLERQWGILFYMFFLCVFLTNQSIKNSFIDTTENRNNHD